MKYLAITLEGFEEEEAMAPFALLRRAGGEVTLTGTSEIVKGSHGYRICDVTDINTINYKEFDALIIPGGGVQYKNLMESKKAHEIIQYFYDANKYIASICAAPTVLGSMGMLKGRNYTCFTAMNADFGGTYQYKGVVVDGKLITARSVAYSLDFAYEIIRCTMDEEKLKEIHTKIYYEK